MPTTYKLRVLESDVEELANTEVELSEERYAFGRATGVGGFYLDKYRCIYVRSNGVSRVHATLELRDGQWWLADDGSSAGTILRGERIQEPKSLVHGDRFTLFKTVFEFVRA